MDEGENQIVHNTQFFKNVAIYINICGFIWKSNAKYSVYFIRIFIKCRIIYFASKYKLKENYFQSIAPIQQQINCMRVHHTHKRISHTHMQINSDKIIAVLHHGYSMQG